MRGLWDLEITGTGRGSKWKRCPQGVITHNRTVEAARKARSKRPASADRMEVMTIIQPLRRPGHVSMELGAFPAHIGIIQRVSIHPKAVCPSPIKFIVLQGLAESLLSLPILSISTSLDQPLFQTLLPWSHLLDYFLQFPTTAHMQQADLRTRLVAMLVPAFR